MTFSEINQLELKYNDEVIVTWNNGGSEQLWFTGGDLPYRLVFNVGDFHCTHYERFSNQIKSIKKVK